MKRLNDTVETGLNVVEKEWRCEVTFVENVGRKRLRCALKAIECEAEFIGNDAVAQPDCLAKELLIEVHNDQSTRQRILGIEQSHVDIVTRNAEVLPQNSVI